jgi:hypothetical protein
MMAKNTEWPEANLSRERQRLLFMEAVCGSPDAAVASALGETENESGRAQVPFVQHD